jgi:hypothetical protein
MGPTICRRRDRATVVARGPRHPHPATGMVASRLRPRRGTLLQSGPWTVKGRPLGACKLRTQCMRQLFLFPLIPIMSPRRSSTAPISAESFSQEGNRRSQEPHAWRVSDGIDAVLAPRAEPAIALDAPLRHRSRGNAWQRQASGRWPIWGPARLFDRAERGYDREAEPAAGDVTKRAKCQRWWARRLLRTASAQLVEGRRSYRAPVQRRRSASRRREPCSTTATAEPVAAR